MNTEQQHTDGIDSIINAALCLAEVDLAAMRERIDRTESVGPILDPTTFARTPAFDALRSLRESVDAAAKFRDSVKGLPTGLVTASMLRQATKQADSTR